MPVVELENTYLAKSLPDGLSNCPYKEMLDSYVPLGADHPVLRLRRNGGKFEITKKIPAHGSDSSHMIEHTIPLEAGEYEALAQAPSKRVHKLRYDYMYKGRKAEIDVFLDELEGLVLVDFEFDNRAKQQAFKVPDFCLADVTQEKFVAGGMLCGRSYSDIADDLRKYGYSKLEWTGAVSG